MIWGERKRRRRRRREEVILSLPQVVLMQVLQWLSLEQHTTLLYAFVSSRARDGGEGCTCKFSFCEGCPQMCIEKTSLRNKASSSRKQVK
mmetsp:Transcript_83793/g.135830  ORF Transcript_83793/g.135830 Transcript_83793/m.135830 type:complete len:90 (-) Transcript_83793:186-455(-)